MSRRRGGHGPVGRGVERGGPGRARHDYGSLRPRVAWPGSAARLRPPSNFGGSTPLRSGPDRPGSERRDPRVDSLRLTPYARLRPTVMVASIRPFVGWAARGPFSSPPPGRPRLRRPTKDMPHARDQEPRGPRRCGLTAVLCCSLGRPADRRSWTYGDICLPGLKGRIALESAFSQGRPTPGRPVVALLPEACSPRPPPPRRGHSGRGSWRGDPRRCRIGAAGCRTSSWPPSTGPESGYFKYA